jgi:lipid-A-disaccharide synthase
MQFQPDVVVFVDYPGFNLRIAEWAKAKEFKTVYYISPQVWAWKENRVSLIRKVVDKMIVILPFEKEFYKSRWQYDVVYAGHPLVEVVKQFEPRPVCLESGGLMTDAQTVALLPGSREQEIKVKLPIMLETAARLPHINFIVARAPSVAAEIYTGLFRQMPNVSLAMPGQTYNVLAIADAALVTSGTATLETALFGVPQVVCYKGSALSYQIAKRLIKIKYISLVNLIMDREVVKELIQHKLTAENLENELKKILPHTEERKQMAADYMELKKMLSQEEPASRKAAREIGKLLGLLHQ